MDVSLVGVGCASVPVTGSLHTTGTWTANADGSYADNTTTTGSVTFPLTPACMTLSSVPTTCDRVGSIFEVLGWSSSSCTDNGSGGCNCSATANQNGGLGYLSAVAYTSGSYATSGSVLTTDDKLKYSYCVSGSTLTVTPQASALSGTIVLQKNGTSGTGGAPGAGGAPGTGGALATGGAPATGGALATGGSINGAGGAPTGGTSNPNATGGRSSTTGGAPPATGGISNVGGVTATGGRTSAAGGTAPATGGGSTSGVGGGTPATGGKSSTGGAPPATGGALATGGSAAGGSTSKLPCDIYAAANNTCVAAHSTVRALFAAYSGKLYRVTNTAGTNKDILTLTAGGVADSSVQDTFCSGTTCTITMVYDQSGHGNDVEAETPTSVVGGHSGETAARATAESLKVGGHNVYSLYTTVSQAYWHNGSTSGMPTGSAPQGIYMVTSGTHFNNGCCYDYGNGETSRTYVAGPSMDSLYFGSSTQWAHGTGSGPWIMADMEDGMVIGNTNTASITYKYVTAIEKNNGTTEWALRGGDATTGTLTTGYKGALPAGKNPMKKQGAVVLGSGGDCCYSNNNGSAGTFYEGAIVSGYPSDATEDTIQANIVSAGYGK